MLIADGNWSFGDASLSSCVFFARGLRVHLMTTEELTFDSRFLCPFQTTGDATTLVALLQGEAVFRESAEAERRVLTRTMFRFNDDEYDRRRPDAPILRLRGRLRRSIEIAMPQGVVVMNARLAPTPHEFVALAETMADRSLPKEARSQACVALCDVLCTLGFTSQPLSDQAREALPESVERVCQALISLYARMDTGAYLELLAGLAGISPRQATRDMVTFLSTFPVPGRTFRELVKVLRIRRAAMLLSARDVSVTSVARDVGYGGLDAMARAFRDAGLPAPSEVRAELRS